MNNLHSSSSFRSACVIQPRHPKTNLPTTSIERKSFDFSPLNNGNTSSPLSDETSAFSGNENNTTAKRKTKSATNRNKNNKSANNKRPPSNTKKKHTSKSVVVGYQPRSINVVNNTSNSSLLFDSKRLLEMKGLSVDDDLFFRHLQALKEENKRALTTLERLYNFGSGSGNGAPTQPPPANQQPRTKKVSRGGNSDEGITSDSNASRNSSENGSNDGYNHEQQQGNSGGLRQSERDMPAESVQGSYIYGFNGNGLLKVVADTRSGGGNNNGYNNSQRHQNGGRAAQQQPSANMEHDNITLEEVYNENRKSVSGNNGNSKSDKQERDSDRENLDLENEYSDCNDENDDDNIEEGGDENGSHYEHEESENDHHGYSGVSDNDGAHRGGSNVGKGYILNGSNGHIRNGYGRQQQHRNGVLRNHSFAGMSRNTSSGYFSAHRMMNNADHVSDMEKHAMEERERVQQRMRSESSEDELDEKLKVRPPPNHVNILPEDERGPFRGRQSNYDVIANMWNNFSVNDTVPPPYTRNSAGRISLRKARSPGGWSPGVTIQEPFKMTLREEKMKDAKDKKIARIKDELLQKQLEDEAELKKRVAPVPVPPSTFLPIYSEKQQVESQKKQNLKQTSKDLLKSIEKPFSFFEREEAKNKLKRSKSMNAKIDSSKTQFKANPYPDKLFDLTWKDKEAEQAEYRKIKIKLRSQEMLAQSSLPPSMATRGDIKNYRKPKNDKNTNSKSSANSNNTSAKKKKKPKNFQPEVRHNIPDFHEMQKKIEMALEVRKNQNTPTICEPFNLHTAQIPSRRSKFNDSVDKSPTRIRTTQPRRPSSSFTRSNTINYKNEQKQRPGSALIRSRSTSGQCGPQNGRFSRSRSISPVYSVTETARRRQELIRQSVEKEKLRQQKQMEEKKVKQKELQKLQRVVAQKTQAHDPSRFRDKQTAEKLANFKRAERERSREYKEFLRSVDQKNEQRPLLFERESQTNAKRQAQKRYEEILRRAGIDGKTLEAFIAGDRELEKRLAEDRADESDADDSDEENADDSEEENDVSEEEVDDVSEPEEEDIPLKSDGMGYDVVLKSNNNSRSYDNHSDDDDGGHGASDLKNDDEDEYSDDAPVDDDSDEESYGEQDDDGVLNDEESDDGSYKP